MDGLHDKRRREIVGAGAGKAGDRTGMNYAYVVKASYGNDSIALIQWAFEQKLNSVAVLYNDTGWASRNWNTRVSEMELWAQSLGFDTHRTKSIGMENLVRQKKVMASSRHSVLHARTEDSAFDKMAGRERPARHIYSVNRHKAGGKREQSGVS